MAGLGLCLGLVHGLMRAYGMGIPSLMSGERLMKEQVERQALSSSGAVDYARTCPLLGGESTVQRAATHYCRGPGWRALSRVDSSLEEAPPSLVNAKQHGNVGRDAD